MNTVETLMYEWKDIPWRELEKVVFKLQKRIYKASSRGDVKSVHRLQKLLMKSWGARCLAVRRVTQENKGKKTAGVDGIKSLKPAQRLKLVQELVVSDKASPTRRVWIPKPGKDEKRPLGIPTIKDRAIQALAKMTMEPQWEAKFESNSYGFRPGRSCHDAREAIFNSIRHKSKFVLDADLNKCFDFIDHQKLLQKLETFPSMRRQIKAWLKSGVMDGLEFNPTERGTPQGNAISPLLANIALHGLEEELKKAAEKFNIKNKNGTQVAKRDKRNALSIIRYADDFVVLHENLEVLKTIKTMAQKWLINMGLELNTKKTRIVHTLKTIGCYQPGFDFLGFNIRQFKVGKYTSGKNSKGKLLGFKTIITPSKYCQENHRKELRIAIKKSKGLKQSDLIAKLNPIIRGWTNYFSTEVSKKVFDEMAHFTFWRLMFWTRRRHRNKGRKWSKTKYFHEIDGRSRVFAIKNGEEYYRLINHADTKIVRHVKVKDNASPYNGDLKYWGTRMGKNPLLPKKVAKLLFEQKGICKHCGLYFREEDVMEVDHIIPRSKGGRNTYENLQLLHVHCHDEKTRIDDAL